MPWMYQVCEENSLSYTFGLSTNPRLKSIAQPLLDHAVQQYARTGQKQRLFMSFLYQAENWEQQRMVVAKAECHAAGTNLRFVVSTEPAFFDGEASADGAQRIYDTYIERGESEQRIDELKNGLHAGRLSCHRFCANFFRLLMHTAAYNLLNALRDHSGVPAELHKAQPQTWRSRVIKVAAAVVQSTRRVVIRLAAQWPHWHLYRAVAESLGGRRLTPTSPIARASS